MDDQARRSKLEEKNESEKGEGGGGNYSGWKFKHRGLNGRGDIESSCCSFSLIRM